VKSGLLTAPVGGSQSPMAESYSEKLVAEVIRIFPSFMKDPIDWEMSKGNAAVAVIEPDGTIRGHIFGEDRAKGRWCFGIVNRKVIQVWSTGYATGRFEELVYAGKLDEGKFGVNRPDFIGWEGGVPLLTPEGKLIAAAFSGVRGVNDIAIIEQAAALVPGLRVKKD
jgi:glc operon protein GlcG